MSALRGGHWWGGQVRAGRGAPFRAVAAATGLELEPDYRDALPAEVDAAVAAAAAAEAPFAAVPPAARAAFLDAIAERLLAGGDELLQRAGAETALPAPRLAAERGRTVHQLHVFAALLREGSWVDARIDRADAGRQPPKPDLRAMLVPLGPVAVFGASNFPLAYSVAGGDTASALAAGCPVVVKAHPAHPGTSELVAAAVGAAAVATGMPAGAFGMVHGREYAVGQALVQDPRIAGVGFTGSFQGGRALVALAAARESPIPVFAEMGSVNPVFVLPDALRRGGAAIAERIAASAVLAMGQFCTSPGLVLVPAGNDGEAFVRELAQRIGAAAGGPLVHPRIRDNFERALADVAALPGMALRAAAAASATACASTGARPHLFATDASTVLAHGRLREEVYGPALVVAVGTDVELLAIARALHGHLTATVHGTAADLAAHGELLAVLRRKVGRLIHDGVPTGVEVVAAMQHGGPWPASSDARFTAVGPRAILRWVRPLCWQDAPSTELPLELQDGNPLGIHRTVDGVLARH